MSVINAGQAVVLGIVEGLTEFLPVSSTGHLKIVEGLMNIPVEDKAVVAFTAVIQTGAIASVLVYFFRDIVRLAGAGVGGLVDRDRRDSFDFRFAWWIVAATVPLVIVGVAAKPLIDGPLASLEVVAASLIAGSAVMWFAERRALLKRGEQDVGFTDCMVIGSSQILALLFPGFSRSGATLSVGLLRGLDRVAATRLSFFLSIPALTGAGLYELKDVVGSSVDVVPLIIGTTVSFVVGYASVAWLLRYVARHTFGLFIVYRLGLAVFLLALLGTGRL
ncbi:undecaprenyl-diphosphate phosphatase [Actinomadura barringtoniae]|uniref:Undecaprenyl-diphosphatase n=1 Tax=Actinomadura barringtoniae TaxID=1427535 RepID=A0A939TAF6_9ACTN|nr:undecaprenyl-diphosphate phosphatase [Actinomadura barringtoniae]